MAIDSPKSAGAFRTISEVAEMFGLPQHILRYWETRFPQLRPLQRAGNRRYYRPDDVALVERINILLNQQGYTVKGVQNLLSGKTVTTSAVATTVPPVVATIGTPDFSALFAIRDRLSRALAADDIAARL
jgi:DNA-binding transcriptional MerR regulator